MAARLASVRLRSQFLRTVHGHSLLVSSSRYPISILPPISKLPPDPTQLTPLTLLRFLSSVRRGPTRPNKVDIGAQAHHVQTRRLWSYALAFSCVAGFAVIVLNQFQDQLVFYLTPSHAMEKYAENPSKNKFRIGGLVVEGNVLWPASSPEFVITDILVRYKGSLPDLFWEGHSVVVEEFVKPFTNEVKEASTKSVLEKWTKSNIKLGF